MLGAAKRVVGSAARLVLMCRESARVDELTCSRKCSVHRFEVLLFPSEGIDCLGAGRG